MALQFDYSSTLNCDKAKGCKPNIWRAMKGRGENVCRDLQQLVYSGGILQLQRKVPSDGNKLAGGVSTEQESRMSDPASTWLNLAFVGSKKTRACHCSATGHSKNQ